MTEAEYHIASFVVHAAPQRATAVAEAMVAVTGIEVHAEHQGKLVVTAEAATVQRLAELSDAIQLLPGVIAVAPVYHEFMDSDAEPTEPLLPTEAKSTI